MIIADPRVCWRYTLCSGPLSVIGLLSGGRRYAASVAIMIGDGGRLGVERNARR